MAETSFIHITDLHIGDPDVHDDHLFSDTSATLKQVLSMVRAVDPAPRFIIASGDLSNRGTPASYRRLREIMSEAGVPVFYALGNHDTRAGFYQGMLGRDHDLEATYDHDQVVGGVHIIVLDTSTPGQIGGTIDQDQFAWLADRLDTHLELPKLIVAHHAPALGDTVPWDHWRTIEFSQSQRLADLLRGRNILAILSGHVHHDRFSLWHGIPVIVGMGQHAATDILAADVLRMVEGASFGIGTVRRSGLTMALVPLPQTRAELNRYELKALRQRQEAALATAG